MTWLLDRLARAFVTLGVLGLLFVAHQVWGTGLRTAWAQRELGAELTRQAAEVARPATRSPGPAGPLAVTGLDASARPLARLTVPRIGLDVVVLDGADRQTLRRGPARVAGTAALGGAGNAVVAGHRATWGAPFDDLDRLDPGDEVVLTVGGADLRYRVTQRRVTTAQDASVLAGTASPTLTLLTCEPRFSSARRLVVTAEAVVTAEGGGGAAAPPVPELVATQGQDPLLLATSAPPDALAAAPPGALALGLWWLTGRAAAADLRRRRTARALAWRVVGAAAAVLPLVVAFDRLADLL